MNNFRIQVIDRIQHNLLTYSENFETWEQAEEVYAHIAERLTVGKTLTFRVWSDGQWIEPAVNMETTIKA